MDSELGRALGKARLHKIQLSWTNPGIPLFVLSAVSSEVFATVGRRTHMKLFFA